MGRLATDVLYGVGNFAGRMAFKAASFAQRCTRQHRPKTL